MWWANSGGTKKAQSEWHHAILANQEGSVWFFFFKQKAWSFTQKGTFQKWCKTDTVGI